MTRIEQSAERRDFQRDYYALFDSVGKVRNYRKAFPLLMVAAKNGHPHAQNLLGYCYDLGLGPSRNARTAVLWYEKAARNGYAEAIYNLALSYAQGKGIPKDERKAFDLNRRARLPDMCGLVAIWERCTPKVSEQKPILHSP